MLLTRSSQILCRLCPMDSLHIDSFTYALCASVLDVVDDMRYIVRLVGYFVGSHFAWLAFGVHDVKEVAYIAHGNLSVIVYLLHALHFPRSVVLHSVLCDGFCTCVLYCSEENDCHEGTNINDFLHVVSVASAYTPLGLKVKHNESRDICHDSPHYA